MRPVQHAGEPSSAVSQRGGSYVSNAQADWEREYSYRRIWIALNEVLTPAELLEVLEGFFDLLEVNARAPHLLELLYHVAEEDEDDEEDEWLGEDDDEWLGEDDEEPEPAEDRGSPFYYVAFFAVVTTFEDAPRLWSEYVRELFPQPPDGWENIGKLANAPKPLPGPSPRIERPAGGFLDMLWGL